MLEDDNTDFEKKIMQEILSLENRKRIGIAVSGGRDSMSLLKAMIMLKDKLSCSIFVVTVDHNIRSVEESGGDADFVIDFCKRNSVDFFEKITIPRNKINLIGMERKKGIEEAARKLRYEIFDEFISKNNLDYLCLGHNKNDLLETILQRFFQGASVKSMCGIAKKRNHYFRPLLGISRKEINEYVSLRKIPFREDATNKDNNYYRNRIRNKLVPFLDENFDGWQTALLHGNDKNILTSLMIDDIVSTVKFEKESSCEVCFDKNIFFSLPKIVQISVLQNALVAISYSKRVSYSFLKSFSEDNSCISSYDLKISINEQKKKICVKRFDFSVEKYSFFVILNDVGVLDLPFGKVKVFVSVENIQNDYSKKRIGPFSFPLCLRSRNFSDEILSTNSSYRSIKKIFSDWNIPEELRNIVPVIEEKNDISAIWGDVLNFPNWYVKKSENRNRCVFLELL